MGLQLSWIAVKDGPMEDILDRLGLEVIGEATDEVGLKLACGRTEQGWSIVVMEDWPKKPDQTMAALAPEGSALFGAMTEIAMFSELRGFEDGRLSWSITRDCDKQGVEVKGVPPAPFDELRLTLEARQAAAGDEQVDHLFDLPPDLSARLCGYQPCEGISDWRVLGRKGKNDTPPPPLPVPSASYYALEAAVKADLLPLLLSLGWSQGDQIVREIGEQEQIILFGYGSGREPDLRVVAYTAEPTASGMIRRGRVYVGDAPVAFWKRFTWRRFWQLTQAPAPADRLSAVIEQAKADIFNIDAYLKNGVLSPHLRIYSWEHPPNLMVQR